ncbi:glycoside hydrolase family 76 protein [Conexibacter woesei]|nr:glycoside hydrolase family 76 protein [Conexibacter woesei]
MRAVRTAVLGAAAVTVLALGAGTQTAGAYGGGHGGGGHGGGPGHGGGHGQQGARERATAAVEAMMGFYDHRSGRFQLERPWWQSGNALQALLDYTKQTGSRRYWWAIDNTIEVQRKEYMFGEFRADSTDDTGWWALAMTRAWDVTRNPKYLEIAKIDEEYIRDYWDDVCGGGVWWDIPQRTYKNAISIELYIKLTAALHNRVRGDRVYRARAIEAWEWLKSSGMLNGDNLFNDGLNTQDGGCQNNGGTTWTYNQGVILGGLAELYRATGDRRLLADARKIADAVLRSPQLNPNGILTEPCEWEGTCNWDQPAFKGIFARNLAELDDLLPGHPYRGWLRAQARSAYDHARNDADQYGLDWDGPFDTTDIARQESAASLLIAVL